MADDWKRYDSTTEIEIMHKYAKRGTLFMNLYFGELKSNSMIQSRPRNNIAWKKSSFQSIIPLHHREISSGIPTSRCIPNPSCQLYFNTTPQYIRNRIRKPENINPTPHGGSFIYKILKCVVKGVAVQVEKYKSCGEGLMISNKGQFVTLKKPIDKFAIRNRIRHSGNDSFVLHAVVVENFGWD